MEKDNGGKEEDIVQQMGFVSHDPVEDTEQYKAIAGELQGKIVARIGEGGRLGYCHIYWRVKKQILKEEYGIDWKSPAELNPFVCFD